MMIRVALAAWAALLFMTSPAVAQAIVSSMIP